MDYEIMMNENMKHIEMLIKDKLQKFTKIFDI